MHQSYSNLFLEDNIFSRDKLQLSLKMGHESRDGAKRELIIPSKKQHVKNE